MKFSKHFYDILQFATNGGKIRSTITVFKQETVRIWNYQLIRYAGYETENGIVGDPDSIRFTKVCEEFGWRGEGTPFDVLPLVIQVGDREPKVFEIPKEYVLEVSIRHPEYQTIGFIKFKMVCSSIRFEYEV